MINYTPTLLNSKDIDFKTVYCADSLHPTQIGYQILSDIICYNIFDNICIGFMESVTVFMTREKP